MIRPSTNQGGSQAGRYETGDEKNSYETFGEGVLLFVERIDVWALQPVRTYRDINLDWNMIEQVALPITIPYIIRYCLVSVERALSEELGVFALPADALLLDRRWST